MRIAVVSDIHGNLAAFKNVLADIRAQPEVDQIILAGDLAWGGPRGAEVVDLVRKQGLLSVQGNTDAFFIPGPAGGETDKGFQALFRWTSDHLGPERCAFLASLPFSHRVSPAPGHDLLVVHANPHDRDRALLAGLDDDALEEILGPDGTRDWEVLAFGHKHTPYVRRWREHLLVNAASAGNPMDGDQRAVYALLTWDGEAWSAEHRRVLYEVPVVLHELQSSDMPRREEWAERIRRARYNN